LGGSKEAAAPASPQLAGASLAHLWLIRWRTKASAAIFHTTVEVGSAEEAKQAVKALQPDLIIILSCKPLNGVKKP
jgi:CheY-like chemotaxis protein